MPVAINPHDASELQLWNATAELATRLRSGTWTLIGAQMVFLLAYEHDLRVDRTSRDIDLLVDVRALSTATEATSEELLNLGYELDPPTLEGVAHRFRRGDAIVDVLAPDGIGPRTSLITVPPSRTIRAPGGSQALRRTRVVEVVLSGRSVRLPCPSLLGGILIKARAIAVGADRDKHRRDLALLLTGVTGPRVMRDELSRAEKGWLRRRSELLDRSHAAWLGIENASDGVTALELLSEHA